ncbi:MAG: hypothetical protein GXY83_35845 [Rhodopirellula sp.]|nr:hypothetical protein [Rhodopirellula sp.]
MAIVGLAFGTEFIPIYQNHPQTAVYAVCRRNAQRLEKIGEIFCVERRYPRYKDAGRILHRREVPG